MSCPSEEAVAAFLEGQLGAEPLAAFLEHIEACPNCVTLIAELAKTDGGRKPPGLEHPPAPLELDEYRLVRPLGRGAMGEVYLAHDTLLDRPVAIKWIAALRTGRAPSTVRRASYGPGNGPDSLDAAADSGGRFLIEARAIARLQHPNILSIHRAGQLDGWYYLVSEYVRGESLDRLSRPVEQDRLLAIGIGLAKGLAAAHRGGVVHGDIKPGNVMLAETGQVKLLDFGVATLFDDESLSKGTGPETATDRGISGTPLYIAPEIWRGQAGTPRSDLYSVGALLYELCSGAPPHEAATLERLRDAVLNGPAEPLLERAPTADPRICSAIDRCLEREPEDRFASAASFRPSSSRSSPGPRRLREGSPGLARFPGSSRSARLMHASSSAERPRSRISWSGSRGSLHPIATVRSSGGCTSKARAAPESRRSFAQG